MKQTNALFDQIQLAEASYAERLGPTISGADLIDALTDFDEDGKFSEIQANRLASRWSVTNAAVGNDPERGFAATIFQRTGSQGEFALVILRPDDLVDDASNVETTEGLRWIR